jgi:hypothetical protein
VQELSQETDTNVLSYSDTGEQKGVVTYYYKDAKELDQGSVCTSFVGTLQYLVSTIVYM